jgi:hypothetical protein
MPKEADNLGAMVAWENGDLHGDDLVELFQGLIDNGMAWQLQGMYGRQAKALIDGGLCHLPQKEPAHAHA